MLTCFKDRVVAGGLYNLVDTGNTFGGFGLRTGLSGLIIIGETQGVGLIYPGLGGLSLSGTSTN